MMKTINPTQFRILAIAPSTRGFGFAVLEGKDSLVDWGVKSVTKEDKNAQSLKKTLDLIAHYQPGVVVLEDTEGSRRSPRVKALIQQIITLAEDNNVKVKLYSREQVMKIYIPNGEGTKHAVAEIIANRFPEQLGASLPPKRKAWESEDARMSIFDAVALALVFWHEMSNSWEI